jgi:hypothetical protein
LPAELESLVGWAAHLSVAATLVTVVASALYFLVDERFGRWTDAASAIQMAIMLPLPVGLWFVTWSGRPVWATLVLAAGVGAMLVAGVLQLLLAVGIAPFDRTVPVVLIAGGVVGLWLVLINYLGMGTGAVPMSLAAAGTIAGAGYVLVAIAFHVGDEHHPLTHLGGLAGCVGYVVWALGVGQLALSRVLSSTIR